MYTKKNSVTVTSFVLHVLRPFSWHIFGLICCGIFWAANISLRPYLLKLILNHAHQLPLTHDFYYIGFLMVVYIMRSNLNSVQSTVYDIIMLKLTSQIKKQSGLAVMQRVTHHSALYFQEHFSGNVINKIENIIKGTPDIVRISGYLFNHVLGFLIAIYTSYCVDASLALLLAVWIASFLIVSVILSKKASIKSMHATSLHAQVAGTLMDILTNMSIIRLFCGQAVEQQRLSNTMQKAVIGDQQRDWAFTFINVYQRVSFAIFQTICFWVLFKGLQNNTLTPGDFALIATLNLSIIDNLWFFAEDIRRFAQETSNVSEGLAAIMIPVDMIDAHNALPLVIKQGGIVFDKVHFAYHGVSTFFNNKSITIVPRQKVGLVGYSGSGKSTFVNLILRVYDIQHGTITIDNQDICMVTQESLRRSIAIIPQESSLFNRTILENIRYGKPSATDHEVIEAAKKADAHDFIMKLPQGYQTLVGERGSKISGGQRQRIAIARALLKDAPLLILDEATSHLDSVTESHIQENLLDLIPNKTTLVIAHRLSTLLHMDRILVFDKGVIVQDGTHQELIEKEGLYKRLWDTQVGGFLMDDTNKYIN